MVAELDPQTTSFAEKVTVLANEEIDVFLELGPHPILASTIKAHLGARAKSPLILASFQRGDSGAETLLSSAAQLYANGFDLEWSRVSPPGRFVRLPTYPWQRERFWIDDGREPHQNGATPKVDCDAGLATQLDHQNGVSNGYHTAPPNGTAASRVSVIVPLRQQLDLPDNQPSRKLTRRQPRSAFGSGRRRAPRATDRVLPRSDSSRSRISPRQGRPGPASAESGT